MTPSIRSMLLMGIFLPFIPHAHAQAPGATQATLENEQAGPYSLVGDIGFYSGIAAGVQVVRGSLGLRGTMGWNPILVTTSDPDTFMSESLHIFSTAQANVDAFVVPLNSAPKVHIGLVASYKYNQLLGHGLGVGFEAQVARSRHFGWHLTLGAAYFPNGDERVADRQEVQGSNNLNFPFGAGIQAGASIGVLFHP